MQLVLIDLYSFEICTGYYDLIIGYKIELRTVNGLTLPLSALSFSAFITDDDVIVMFLPEYPSD